MKILSSFTHPQVVANLHEFLSSAEQKGRYFEEGLEQSCLAPLTSMVEKKWKPKFQSFFGISSFLFSRRTNLIQVVTMSNFVGCNNNIIQFISILNMFVFKQRL